MRPFDLSRWICGHRASQTLYTGCSRRRLRPLRGARRRPSVPALRHIIRERKRQVEVKLCVCVCVCVCTYGHDNQDASLQNLKSTIASHRVTHTTLSFTYAAHFLVRFDFGTQSHHTHEHPSLTRHPTLTHTQSHTHKHKTHKATPQPLPLTPPGSSRAACRRW